MNDDQPMRDLLAASDLNHAASSLSEPSDTPISDLIPTKEADPELVAHLRETIAALEREVAEAHQRHVTEIRLISERLNEEADEHDLCSAYESILRDINADERITVPLLMRDVDVVVQARGQVTFTFDRRFEIGLPMGTDVPGPLAQERTLALVRSIGLNGLARQGGGEVVNITLDPVTY